MDIAHIDIKKILYATDLSAGAHHALAYAVSLADRYQAELSLLHVLEELPDLDNKVIGYISGRQWEEIKLKHENAARATLTGKLQGRGALKAVLGKINKNVRGGFPQPRFKTGNILVERGNPVEVILVQAEKIGIDLIVMGTHGQGTFTDSMMGSTARRVLRRSSKPVLVVRLPQ